MPSARRAAMAGATISASSLPSAPCSPACGFSPATARRGRAMPKSRRRAAAVVRATATISCGVQHRDRVAQRDVNGHRHHAQGRAGEHHHLAPRHAGQFGQELGVARMRKAGLVERRFVDRVGDDRACLAPQRKIDRALDRGNDGGRIRRVRLPLWRWRGQPHRQHRQCVGKNRRGFCRRCDRRAPEPATPCASRVRPADRGRPARRTARSAVPATRAASVRRRCRPDRPW